MTTTHTPSLPSSQPAEFPQPGARVLGSRRGLGRTALIGLCAGATALTTTMTTAVVSAAADDAERPEQSASQQADIAALAARAPQVIDLRLAPQRASRSARTAPVGPATPPQAARAAKRTKLVWRTKATGRTFRGEASWYGPGFQGRRTANGERYDMHALTAAHKTLPFGTRLEVCRADRCVVVRINDRGPFVGDRVLDLSKAAAQRLGYSGVATVSATPVRRTQVRTAA